MSKFVLLGYDCPYAVYPAPVIPVGLLDGQLVAIYPGGVEGPTPEPIGEDDDFVRYDTPVPDFDYRVYGLFAEDPDHVSLRELVAEPEGTGTTGHQALFRSGMPATKPQRRTSAPARWRR